MLNLSNALKSVAISAALGAIAFAPVSAKAANFTGAYDVSNWTFESTNGGDGSVDLVNAPNSITITGSNNSVGTSLTSFTVAAAQTGTVSFAWDYVTRDVDGLFFDSFVVINDTLLTLTADILGPNTQSGQFSFDVNKGDIFGFGIDSFDSEFGSASVTISEFTAPEAVPEPTMMLGMAAVSAVTFVSRKKRNCKTVAYSDSSIG